jgi:hypothetical protein
MVKDTGKLPIRKSNAFIGTAVDFWRAHSRPSLPLRRRDTQVWISCVQNWEDNKECYAFIVSLSSFDYHTYASRGNNSMHISYCSLCYYIHISYCSLCYCDNIYIHTY